MVLTANAVPVIGVRVRGPPTGGPNGPPLSPPARHGNPSVVVRVDAFAEMNGVLQLLPQHGLKKDYQHLTADTKKHGYEKKPADTKKHGLGQKRLPTLSSRYRKNTIPKNTDTKKTADTKK